MEPLPLDFQRLVPTDYERDGVHLSAAHYRTIRCAIEEEALAHAISPCPIRPICLGDIPNGPSGAAWQPDEWADWDDEEHYEFH